MSIPTPSALLLPDIPLSIDAVCAKCLQKSPADRNGSMGKSFKHSPGLPGNNQIRYLFILSAGNLGIAEKPEGRPWLRGFYYGYSYGIYWFIDRSAKISWAGEKASLSLCGLLTRTSILAHSRSPIKSRPPSDDPLLKTWPRFTRYVNIISKPEERECT